MFTFALYSRVLAYPSASNEHVYVSRTKHSTTNARNSNRLLRLVAEDEDRVRHGGFHRQRRVRAAHLDRDPVVEGRGARTALRQLGATMVDKTGLTIIGCIFGATTAVVLLVATLLVSTAVASGEAGREDISNLAALSAPR